MSGLPPGWAQCSLADVADVVRGVTYRKADARSDPRTGCVPILRATNIDGRLLLDSDMVYVPERYVARQQWLERGDIVVATSSGSPGVVGKSAQLVDGWKGSFGAFCSVIRPRVGMDAGYVSHFVSSPSVRRLWRSLAQGTNINNLKARDLAETVVPVPPENEQRRIVAAIDQHFSGIDSGAASVARARQGLNRMRAAVLQAALSGSLVPGNGLTPIRCIGDAISYLDQGWSPRCEKVAVADDTSWGVIKTSAVQPMRFDDTANKRLPSNLTARPNREIFPGDLLITRAGPRARAGVCCLVRGSRRRLMICDKVYRFRAAEEVALPEYLEIALNAPSTTRYIDAIKTGISDSGVNITQRTFRSLQLPIPPIAVQARIVAAVEEWLAHISALEGQLGIIEKRANTLKSTVLIAAFAGTLVAQDAQDVPGARLLERIAAERARSAENADSEPRRRRTRTVKT